MAFLKKGDYCFGVFNEDNPNCKQSIIIIYKVIASCKELDQMEAETIDTTSENFPKNSYFGKRRMSYYTKCKAKSIKELREEFPEEFI